MAGLGVRESVTLAGRAERARAARWFVGEVLGAGHPCGNAAVLLVSEAFAQQCPALRKVFTRRADGGWPCTLISIAEPGPAGRASVVERYPLSPR